MDYYKFIGSKARNSGPKVQNNHGSHFPFRGFAVIYLIWSDQGAEKKHAFDQGKDLYVYFLSNNAEEIIKSQSSEAKESHQSSDEKIIIKA